MEQSFKSSTNSTTNTTKNPKYRVSVYELEAHSCFALTKLRVNAIADVLSNVVVIVCMFDSFRIFWLEVPISLFYFNFVCHWVLVHWNTRFK